MQLAAARLLQWKKETDIFFFVPHWRSFLLSKHFSTVVILIYWSLGCQIPKESVFDKEETYFFLMGFFGLLDFRRNKCLCVQNSSSSKQKSLHTNYSQAF